MKLSLLQLIILSAICFSCKSKEEQPLIQSLADLKRGEIISCSPQGGEVYGTVSFPVTISPELQKDFDKAIALLHSFEYDEAEKMFASVIDKSPRCAMAYWGVAMANFHPLWAPPGPAELKKGAKAIDIARSIKDKTKREEAYINALAEFYAGSEQTSHRDRVLKFEKEMENLYRDHPGDPEAAVFYALALNAAADPLDKTYARQRKAVSLLQPVFDQQPMHPGIAHYIIHNCDYPELASIALPAARKYALIAPSSAHAQHMPSHIFTRLGLWQECIVSNLASAYSAKCYADKAKLKGHWDEELHAMDYLVYAYLQMGADDSARLQVDYLKTINEVSPLNFKTAYAFAAIPARYLLERKKWKEAAHMSLHPLNYPWEKFSWQRSIHHFARMLGSIHTGDLNSASKELNILRSMHEQLSKEKEKSKEMLQVDIQVKTGEAWLLWKQGKGEQALALMTRVAEMEDSMEKHPVTPGEVIPARELLAEMLMEMNKPEKALEAFEQDLQTHANRFNALYGAGMAAQNSGNREKALYYFNKLVEIAGNHSKRPEVKYAKSFVKL